MTTKVDELDFERASRRIVRFLAYVAVAGTVLAGAAGGWKWAAGFLAGSAAAWFNFRWLKQLVHALGGERAHSSFRWALRYFLFGGCGYVIVRFSSIPAPAFIAGMLALIAAIFIEILFELVYARKRTLDHQDF
ncbi:MAG: ATP synthase subunit I [Bryobacteraceae bacterium]|jgi:TRAP-type C4-dicarboxylate transport system permease small subunit